MKLRNGHYIPELVKELIKVSSILKLNNEETKIFFGLFDKKPLELKDFCKWALDDFDLEGVCFTMGSEGCVVYLNGEYLESPGYKVEAVDPVGAGDAFTAGFLHGLSKNWRLNKVCDFANRLSTVIIKKIGAIPDWTIEEVFSH